MNSSISCGFRRSGHREVRDERRDRPIVHAVGRDVVGHHPHRVAGDQLVLAERLAREEHAARQPERRIQLGVERRLEAADVDAERAEESLRDVAVERVRRLQRLAAAVAHEQPVLDRELVALRVPAEIVVVVEQQDPRVGPTLPVEPRRGEPADPRADDHEVEQLLDGEIVDPETSAVADRVGGLERAGMASAEPRLLRWVRRPVEIVPPDHAAQCLTGNQGPSGRGYPADSGAARRKVGACHTPRSRI